ncbi:MAG: DUF4249 family protein [Bacteroidales bacterium]|nr:DUF4249 family protein [Bacteroidales bacterium]
MKNTTANSTNLTNSTKAIISTVLIVFCISSCVHEFPFSIDEIQKNTVVVEGEITNEFINHTVYLSMLSDYQDTARIALRGAKVAVTSGDSTYLYKETSDGIYTSTDKFAGITGNLYSLHVEIRGAVLSAQTTMLPVTPPDKITYNIFPDKMSVNTVAEPYVLENPAKYVLKLSWAENNAQKNATLYYYSLTTVDISQLFAPKIQETFFPRGTQIIERKYSIDKDYEKYLRSLLAETLWSGGYFDEAHGNLHTNIESDNPIIKTAGYFSASTVFIDTLIAR